MGKFLGYFENEKVFLNMGKYGPFLSHMKKTYSIPSEYSDDEFILMYAIKIIESKRNIKKCTENVGPIKYNCNSKPIEINDYSCLDKLEITGEKSTLCDWLERE